MSIGSKPCVLLLTGGQRNERKKWVNILDSHCIFVIGLTQYFMTCYEDESTNRLDEDLTVLKKISHEFYQNRLFILVLNKVDIFEEILKQFPYENYHKKEKESNTPLEDIIEKCQKQVPNKDLMTIKIMSALNEDDILSLMDLCKKVFL